MRCCAMRSHRLASAFEYLFEYEIARAIHFFLFFYCTRVRRHALSTGWQAH
jgi:hypothetical protein